MHQQAAAGSGKQQQASAGSRRQQQAAAGSRQQQAAADSSRQQEAAAGSSRQQQVEGFGCCGSLGGCKGGFGALWEGSRRCVGWLVVWLVFGWWKMGLGIGRGAFFLKRCIRDCARCLHFLSSRSRVGPFLVFFKKRVPRYSFRPFFWKCCSRYSVVLFFRKGAQKFF